MLKAAIFTLLLSLSAAAQARLSIERVDDAFTITLTGAEMGHWYQLQMCEDPAFQGQILTIDWPCGFCTSCWGCDLGWAVDGVAYYITLPFSMAQRLNFRLAGWAMGP